MFLTRKTDTVERLFINLIGVQVLSFISQIIANVIDAITIERFLGPDAMAAFSYAGTAVCIVMAAFGFLMTGVSVLMSRDAGEQDEDKKSSAFSTAILFALLTGFILTLVCLCTSRQMAGMFGSFGQLRELTAAYIRGYAPGILPFLLFAVLSSAVLVDGGKKQLMFSFALMAGVEIALDLLNGCVFHLGLWGMGAATSISEYAALAVILLVQLRKQRRFLFSLHMFRLTCVRDIFEYGHIYVVKQMMITVLGFTYNNYIGRRYGADILAVYAATLAALSFLQCVSSSIGNTVSMLTGFYAKEEDGTSLKRLMTLALKYSVLLNSVMLLIAFIAAGPIMELFYRKGDHFYLLAIVGFRLISLSIILRSINMSIRGYYQGMKMQIPNLIFTFLQTIGCEVASLFVLDALIGKAGFWLSYMAGELIAVLLLVCVLRLRTGEKNPVDAIMMLPEVFLGEAGQKLDTSCHSMEEIMKCAEEVFHFSGKEGTAARVPGIMSLAIEEIGRSIMQYGSAGRKAHSIDIRVKENQDNWMLRFYDDCACFDPEKCLREDGSADRYSGIRLIRSLASDVQYAKAMGLNLITICVEKAPVQVCQIG